VNIDGKVLWLLLYFPPSSIATTKKNCSFYDNKQAKELIEDVILWLEKQRIPRDHIQAFHQTLSVGSSNTFCGFISLGHSIQTNCFKKPQWSIEALIQTIILK
jgi:hypothetical protein